MKNKYAIEFLKTNGLDESLAEKLMEFIEYERHRRYEEAMSNTEIKKRLKVIASRMNAERDEAKELLKTYNRWIRGEETQPDPVEIGKAIDKLTL